MPDVSLNGIEFRIKGSSDQACASLRKLNAQLSTLRSNLASVYSASRGARSISDIGQRAVVASGRFRSLAIATGKFGLKLASIPLKKAVSGVKDFAGGIKSVVGGFKRIVGYRIIRSIIKEITQGFSEGIKNLYGWSTLVGGKFAASMNSITTSMTYFKNSIGAAVAPIINALAPAIDILVDKIVTLINVVNQLFAKLTGAASWTKAIKKAQEYDDAVSGAGGAAKKALEYLAPFDELNVLPDYKNGGGGGGNNTDYSGMFEEVTEFGEAISDFADHLKEKINAGDWQGVGTLLGGKINDIVDSINWSGLGTKVGEKINALFTTEYWTLKTINFQNIGASIAEFLTGEDGIGGALRAIDFHNIGGIIAEKMTIIPDLLIGAINRLDFGLVGKSIGDTIKGFFNNLSDWLQEVDWAVTAANLLDGIVDFIEGLDISGIVSSILTMLGSIVGAVASALTGVLTEIVDTLTSPDTWTLVWAWMQDLPAKFKQAGINAVNALVNPIIEGINNLIEKYPNLAAKLGIDGPIEFQLIPNISDEELTKHYDAAKAKIEAQSKKSPVPVSAIAGLMQATRSFTKTSSGVTYTDNGYPIISSIANFYQAKKDFTKASGFTLDDKGNLSCNTIADFVNAKRNFEKASGMTLTSGGYPVISSIADFINATRNLKKASGMTISDGGLPIISSIASFEEAKRAFQTGTGMDLSAKGFPVVASIANFINAKKAFTTGSGGASVSDGNPVFNSIANFVYATPNFTKNVDKDKNPYINVNANAVAFKNSLGYKPEVDVNARVTGMTNVNMTQAQGGVYSGGRWHNIAQFASGGLAKGSQLFWAREQGPELVGTLGGHTAVMNNDQIVSSVSAGVARAIASIKFHLTGLGSPSAVDTSGGMSEDVLYRAFRRALDETDFGGDIELDGYTLYSAMVKRNKMERTRTGVNPMMLGG